MFAFLVQFCTNELGKFDNLVLLNFLRTLIAHSIVDDSIDDERRNSNVVLEPQTPYQPHNIAP